MSRRRRAESGRQEDPDHPSRARDAEQGRRVRPPRSHNRTAPVKLDPPQAVPLTPDDERAAITALAELLADLLDTGDGTTGR